MSAEPIRVRRLNGVATIELNRPEARNAIDDAMRGMLVSILDEIARDAAVRAVIVTGAGKAFCAGGDVRAMQARLAAPQDEVAMNGWRRQQRTHHAITALHTLPKPTIAAINGAATGLGCDLALCCDFVIAGASARLAMSYVLRGLIPDGGGMYFLPRRVGLSRAKELIFSGRTVAAEEALRIGMVDRVAQDDSLLADAQEWGEQLAAGSPTAIALSKSILDQSFELTLEQVFAQGSQAQGICYSSREHRESVAAFLEKAKQRTEKP
jgi:enoyl-CoA hydratase/carnithine racemase